MQRQRDANEIAFRTLCAALYPHAGRKGDPRLRAGTAMRVRGVEAIAALRFDRIAPKRQHELAMMGGEANRRRLAERR